MAVKLSKDVIAEPVIEAEQSMIVEHPTVNVEVASPLMDTEISQELLVCVEQESDELVELVVSIVAFVLDLALDCADSVLVLVGSSVLLGVSGGPGCRTG